MPPAVGHYRPNISNPFNQLSQQHTMHQPSHYTPQGSTTYTQPSHYTPSSHTSFPTQTSNTLSLFGGGLSNGSLNNNFGAALPANGGGTGLASHEAQMRFAHGAVIQQQQEQGLRQGGMSRIREVWAGNLEKEMEIIRGLVDRFPFVSMVRNCLR